MKSDKLKIRNLLPVFVGLLILVGAFLPILAMAEERQPERDDEIHRDRPLAVTSCMMVTMGTYYLESFESLDGPGVISYPVPPNDPDRNVSWAVGPPDGKAAMFTFQDNPSDSGWGRIFYDMGGTFSGTITVTTIWSETYNFVTNERLYAYLTSSTVLNELGAGSWSGGGTGKFRYLVFHGWGPFGSNGHVRLESSEILFSGQYCGAAQPPVINKRKCDTVKNADFDTDQWLASQTVHGPTHGWSVHSYATISNSNAVIPSGDWIEQGLLLADEPSQYYYALITVSDVSTWSSSAEVYLNVGLGFVSQTVHITQPGRYMVGGLMVTLNMAGVINFKILNVDDTPTNFQDDNIIYIDYVCLYGYGDFEDDRECFAPDNGDFSGILRAGEWPIYGPHIRLIDWIRGGNHPDDYPYSLWPDYGWLMFDGTEIIMLDSGEMVANLPYNPGSNSDRSDLWTDGTYNLPLTSTLRPTEHILLSFDASSYQNDAIAWSSADVEMEFDPINPLSSTVIPSVYEIWRVYPDWYRYEFDISELGGHDVMLRFTNLGKDPGTEFEFPSDLRIDNVCIYIGELPGLPEPLDEKDRLKEMTDLLLTSTCADIPAILYGFGIDVYDLIDVERPPLWDLVLNVDAWLVWLAAELWMNIGWPLACWMLELLKFWLKVFLEFFYDISNYFNFFDGSLETFSRWLEDWVDWVDWLWDSLAVFFGGSWENWLQWIKDNFGIFGEYIAGGMEWFGEYGWRAVWNWLVPNEINPFMELLNGLLGGTWGELSPFLQSVWRLVTTSLGGLLGDGGLLLLDMAGVTLESIGMLLQMLLFTFIDLMFLPFDLYAGFQAGIQENAYDIVTISCNNENFWCSFLAGYVLLNQGAAHTVMYPLVIVGIILGTIWVVRKNLVELLSINLK